MSAVKYRPTCGSEGMDFICAWCGKCERDIDGDCPIVAATFVYELDDPSYPAEWIHDVGGPRCTAFVALGEPVPTPRCTATVDMFGHARPA